MKEQFNIPEIEDGLEIEVIKRHLDFLASVFDRIKALETSADDMMTVLNNYINALKFFAQRPPREEGFHTRKLGDKIPVDENLLELELSSYQNSFLLSLQIAELKSSQ